MQTIPVNIRCVCKVLAILIQHDVFSQIVQVLKLTSPETNPTIAPFDVRRTDQSPRVGNYQLLVMPTPNVPTQVSLY